MGYLLSSSEGGCFSYVPRSFVTEHQRDLEKLSFLWELAKSHWLVFTSTRSCCKVNVPAANWLLYEYFAE